MAPVGAPITVAWDVGYADRVHLQTTLSTVPARYVAFDEDVEATGRRTFYASRAGLGGVTLTAYTGHFLTLRRDVNVASQ